MDDKRTIIEFMINMFTRITTLIIICAGIYIWIFWGPDVDLGYDILFGIPLIGALTSIPCTLLFYKDDLSKKSSLIRTVAFYLYINVIVFGFGKAFDWVRFDTPGMAIGMALDIMAVYLFVCLITYFLDWRVSDKMNKRLLQLQKEKE